ncbi:MAG: hypothetical protein AAGC46_15355 [Solirubrobacteraceae bacterium]|nr:hypothetical protein [Patulibacter sp.]
MHRCSFLVALAGASLLTFPQLAGAATLGVDVPVADFLGIGHALLGGLSFTAGFFRDLFTALLGGIADMLVPDSWASKGPALLTWLVASPDFTLPAFSDLQRVSNISLWLGIACLPTTLAVSIGLPHLGLTPAGDAVGPIIGRTAAATAGLILWGPLWSQGAALCNTVSHAYLGDHIATSGMNAYMSLIAVGGALGGIPILGILIVLFAGALFLAALVMKVFVLLIGGLLFASGPLLLGVVPTQRGAHLSRTWLSALLMTWILPILWGLVFVVSGAFVHRAAAIGSAIGGSGSIAATGGTLVAGCAAIVGPLLCISLTRAALGPLGHQFGAMASVLSPRHLTQRLTASRVHGASGAARGGDLVGAARTVRTSSGGGSAAAVAGMTSLMSARSSARGAARSGAFTPPVPVRRNVLSGTAATRGPSRGDRARRSEQQPHRGTAVAAGRDAAASSQTAGPRSERVRDALTERQAAATTSDRSGTDGTQAAAAGSQESSDRQGRIENRGVDSRPQTPAPIGPSSSVKPSRDPAPPRPSSTPAAQPRRRPPSPARPGRAGQPSETPRPPRPATEEM